jgi:putative flippase GtrA
MALHAAGLQAWVASFVAYLICTPIGYLGQRHITFQSRATYLQSFVKYAGIQALGLMLSAVLPYLLPLYTEAPAIVGFLLVSIVLASLNFTLMKFWAYAERA